MDNKKIGIILLILTIIIGSIIVLYNNELRKKEIEMGCYREECSDIEALFSVLHGAIGAISFMAALGFYLIFFTKSEEAIIERLEEEKKMKLKEDKFSIMMKMLGQSEQKIFKAIKEQDGITQSTLVFRAGLSKSKISQVLKEFEDKKLIGRKRKGKTYSIHLLEDI